MGDANLELMAMRWLRWEKRCAVVVTERSPRESRCGRPDVLGMTQSRYLCEIEIKRSMADFRADAAKPSRRNRDLYSDYYPKQFYYLVPNAMAFKVNGELPEWAGLMRGPGSEDVQCVHVVKTAPVWKPSKRLSLKESVHMCMLMASQIVGLAESREAARNRMEQNDGNDSWRQTYHPQYVNFQI